MTQSQKYLGEKLSEVILIIEDCRLDLMFEIFPQRFDCIQCR